MTKEEYLAKYFEILDWVKDDIITPNSTGSAIKTRFITSQGAKDEQWLGYLRDLSAGKTDIWLLTFNELRGLGFANKEIGSTTKDVAMEIDYFYDYRQGTDAENSEITFLTNILFTDYALEEKQGMCGVEGVKIKDWSFKLRLKRFTNDTTHWMTGIINFQVDIQF